MSSFLLGIGSSLSDRTKHISLAIRALDHGRSRVKRVSRLYLTPPSGGAAVQPFLNCAAIVDTSMGADELLGRCQQVERRLGRRDVRRRWGDRVIDIDILLERGAATREAAALRVPHPLLLERSFAWIPAVEIAAHWMHPDVGQKLGEVSAVRVPSPLPVGVALGGRSA